MRRLVLFCLAVMVSFFGMQTPLVNADAPQCGSYQSWSPIDVSKNQVLRNADCQEYFVDALPAQLVSQEYLEQYLSSPRSNFNPSDAFALHSNPTANAIIYLDFDGHTWLAGSWWIGAYGIDVGETSAGYTLDNDASTFTEIERNAIYEIWANVAEEFAMYDVDVTTERPTGARDVIFQTRGSYALILSEASVQEGCSCGGVAHLDVFSSGNVWNHPNLNFSKFGSYFAPPADTAEIISHEVGHNLGLAHDGTTTGIEYYGGHAMWTPIMGAGRGRGIATWSYGGYPNADTRWNQISGDDDYAQMDYYMDFYSDDFGNTLLTAEALSAADIEGLTRGVISTREDIDMFRFEVTDEHVGMWEIELLPAEFAPNLDAELKLYDTFGTLLATENPLVSVPSNYYTNLIDGLDARMKIELAAGVYYLSVDGVGQGSLSLGTGYDDYASRGTYSLRFATPSSGVFVRRVLPSSGGVGTAVRVLGSKLDEVTGVRMGSIDIPRFTSISDNEIVFGVPSGTSSASLILETNTGDIVAVENFTVLNQDAAPIITSISSMTGVIDQLITIEGQHLGAATSVTLADQPIDFTVTSATSIVFRVTSAMLSGQLSVFTQGGNDSVRGTFSVLIPMSLTSFTPSAAFVGANLTIVGSHFTSDTKVTFFGGVVGSRPRISTTQITLRIPSGALTGPITLTNSIGSVTSAENLTILAPAPRITKFSPTTARVGNVVTISGTNFVNVQSVTLGVQSTTFTVVSPTSIRFIVPVGARSATISVTTPSGTARTSSQLRIR